MCSLLASLNIHAALVVFQLSLVTLSQHASGLHLITATRVTGWWQLQSSMEAHMPGWCQRPTTHWEAPMVTVLQWCVAGPGTCATPFKESPLIFIHFHWYLEFPSWNSHHMVSWTGIIMKLPENCQTYNVASCFFCHRAFPTPKPFPCWEGCWNMQIPLNQPSSARKWQTVHFSAGSVWGCSGSGEPHSPN